MRGYRVFVSVLALMLVSFALTGCGGTASANNPSGGNASPSPAPSASPTPPPAPSASPTPIPSPSPTPTPVAPSSTVIDNIEDSPNWLTCGACGNTGGTGAVAPYTFTPGMGSPSEDGASTQFSIAATVAFTNGYFFRQQPPITKQIDALTYEFDLYIPSGMETAPQAIEFECQQIIGGWVYNFAWQAEYHGTKVWRIFDYGLKRWDVTPVAFQGFTPGTWHHMVAEYHNDTANHVVWHDALTIDGVRFPVNISHNAFFSGGGNQFTNAFQLDSNSVPAPYSVYVDKMKITYR